MTYQTMFSALVLLVTPFLNPAVGQENDEKLPAEFFRRFIPRLEKQRDDHQNAVKRLEHQKTIIAELLGLAEEDQKSTEEAFSHLKAEDGGDQHRLAEAKDEAELAGLEVAAARKRLQRASSLVEARSADLEECEANLAYYKARLKAIESPTRADSGEIRARAKRYAQTRLGAVRAKQSSAERDLEVEEAEVAVARKRVAIAKVRVARMVEKVERTGKSTKTKD